MADSGELVHIGCYTPQGGGRGKGIVAARRDPRTGRLDILGTVAATPSPSFLTRHPRLPVLYAVGELDDGVVTAWGIGPDGGLAPLGSQPTGGAHPCHLAVSADGGHLFSANYGGGSVAVHPLDPAGVPGPRSDLIEHHGHSVDPDRQAEPHVHMVSPDPDGGPLLTVDLGTDAVYRYQLDPATGRLGSYGTPVRTSPGTGPRHLARHPDGRFFLVGELGATLHEYGPDGAGTVHERSRVPASERRGHVQPSEVAVRGDGRFVYVGNRGVDTVSVFALDTAQPRLVAEVGSGGHWPRHLVVTGTHLYVANERSDTIGVFAVDAESGVPTPLGEPVPVPSPTCILTTT
ncbi:MULTISPECIES: lactonase family protein [Polymorphospora]|uniref:Lactonase family protein n=1 Tax=Polymorphospora lycopeni TaxID=3140240 RepID=A0ABV5CNX1_9ACTN